MLFWHVDRASPLRTRSSDLYEKDGGGEFPDSRGELSWTWEIKPVRLRKGTGPADEFGEDDTWCGGQRFATKEINRRLRVGPSRSGPPTPPAATSTPTSAAVFAYGFRRFLLNSMDTLEFLLGKLFQNDWPEHASSETPDVQFWRSKQTQLITKVLEVETQEDYLRGGIALGCLKAKPEEPDELFLVSNRK